MHRHHQVLLAVATISFLTHCASTTEVVPVAKVKPTNKGGVMYYLPRTALVVEVPVILTRKSPGKFIEHAEKLFGEPAEIKQEASETRLGDPTIAPIGYPDEDKAFYAQIRGGPFTDASMNLQLDPDGLLTSAQVEAENKTVDFIVATLESGAKIASAAAGLASAREKNADDVTALLNTNPALRSAYDRARAANIMYRDLLSSNIGANDLPTFQARLAEAKDVLKSAMAPFYGTTREKTWVIRFVIDPAAPSTNVNLFRYDWKGVDDQSFTAGYLPTNRKKGNLLKPDDAGIVQVKVPATPVTVNFTLNIEDKRKATDHLFTQAKRGIHYNIPSPGSARIKEITQQGEQKLILGGGANFGQFGSLAFLPATTGSRKLRQEVSLDPATGALLKVSNVSGAFDAALVNRTGDAISSLVKTGGQ